MWRALSGLSADFAEGRFLMKVSEGVGASATGELAARAMGPRLRAVSKAVWLLLTEFALLTIRDRRLSCNFPLPASAARSAT